MASDGEGHSPVMLFSRMLVMVLAVLALADVALVASGRWILVGEARVSPGQTYVVGDHGNLGRNEQASLVCRYFTGRRVLTKVYWYSADTLMAKAKCPFLTTTE
jgi:hypothetical protein